MLQPSDKDFKITTINMLTDLVGNEDNCNEQRGNAAEKWKL